MSDYDFVARGSIKLKKDNFGITEKNKKKKKNKSKERERFLEKTASETSITTVIENDSNSNGSTTGNNQLDKNAWMTEAQKKFLAQQEKRQLARVMAKASKTHKQRVEEFNSNLEKLSEHYDIPKVSWTK